MSSTGIITNNVISPTTKIGGFNKNVEQGLSAFPGLHEGVRQIFGKISKVHQQKPLIKATDDQGSSIANDNWIPLNHSPGEIISSFGTIRRGMRVLVSYVGPDGAGANATIVGDEQQKHSDVPMLPNEVKQNVYRIFSPGSGVG